MVSWFRRIYGLLGLLAVVMKKSVSKGLPRMFTIIVIGLFPRVDHSDIPVVSYYNTYQHASKDSLGLGFVRVWVWVG